MEKIEKGITVNASLEKVFNYIENPVNWPEFWSSLIEITDVQSLPTGGYRAKYEYKMAGMRFKGEAEFFEYVPGKRFDVNVKGGIDSTLSFDFHSIKEKPDSGKTRIRLTVIYQIPVPLIGKLAEMIVHSMNEHDIELLMNNLSARFLLDY